MAYKIAVASSDGIHVDQSFRDALIFTVFDVSEDGSYQVKEKRKWNWEKSGDDLVHLCGENGIRGRTCGDGKGCGDENFPKVGLIADCRCIVCTKIGFKIQRQLEKRAISSFDVECPVAEAFAKIIPYFEKVDKHQSFREIAHGRQQKQRRKSE